MSFSGGNVIILYKNVRKCDFFTKKHVRKCDFLLIFAAENVIL